MDSVQINHERIKRMMGKRIETISFGDMRDSNFEEYHLSRIWAAGGLVMSFLKDLARPLYKLEYNSYKQHPKYWNWNLKPEYQDKEGSPDLDRYKAPETIETK